MSFDADRLYDLLPALYRIRDAGQGQQLKALLTVIAEQVAVLEEDLEQLYDDQFIETCAEWAIPYIGDLIGYRALHAVAPQVGSPRSEVANTIAYRRGKGTAAILEQLARDVTGCPARVIEFFQLLATTQSLNHLRPNNRATPDLRRWQALEHLDTAFDTIGRTADVRRIATGRGRYNIPNLGIFIWRLRACSLTLSPAARLKPGDPNDQRYLFSPLGNNTPLFTLPQTESAISQLAGPLNLPIPISRRMLDAHLADYYGRGKSFVIQKDGLEIPLEKIVVCNLSDMPDSAWTHQPPADQVAVDPELGRFVFSAATAGEVRVSFHYGFSADLGGGEYERMASFDAELHTIQQVPGPHPSIQAALDALGGADGVVEILDSGRYTLPQTITLAENQHVELRAANKCRPTLMLEHDLAIVGSQGAELTLNGLLIGGGALRVSGQAQQLRLRHCTLVPGQRLDPNGTPQDSKAPSLVVDTSAPPLLVEIDHCIVGGLRVTENVEVAIADSIVDAMAENMVAYAAPDRPAPPGDPPITGEAGGLLRVENSTIVGKVHTTRLELASNTIFLARFDVEDTWHAPVLADRRQQGCVRFSYLPPDARVPRRYYCQPRAEEDAARVRPDFSSLRYGHPAYAQLSRRCPVEISKGADDESEIGAFHQVYQPQRETNLRVRLEEYLRFGLEAAILLAS
jgi:hypothetical protein